MSKKLTKKEAKRVQKALCKLELPSGNGKQLSKREYAAMSKAIALIVAPPIRTLLQ